MELQAQLVQRQTQRLALTPRMQQAIKVLQLSTLELNTFLRQELVENPLLEERLDQEEPPEAEGAKEEPGEDDAAEDLNVEEYLEAWNDYFYEGSDFSVNTDPDAKRNFIENSITASTSLTHHLLEQLQLSVFKEIEYKIGEWIIGEINEKGYFAGLIEEGAAKFGVEPEDVEAVLQRIQTFDPTGIGARNLKECLLIQLNSSAHKDDVVLRKMIEDCLELLEKRLFSRMAKKLGISVEQVQHYAEMVSKFEPWPGRRFAPSDVQYITPDVTVKKIDDEYVVVLSDDSVPRLRISSYYRRLLQDKNATKETSEYLQNKLNSAKWLIRNIEQRKSTIYKVTKCIVDMQREFLEKGPAYLKPLTLQEVADRVSMHESTISRVTTNKYVETPQGIFELKYFFSSGIQSTGGEDESSSAIRAQIQTLLDAEDKKTPLSDQKITDILRKSGLNIARRTVTKYREALGILPSKLRRVY